LFGWLVVWLVGWLFGCLVVWLLAWLVGWLVGWLGSSSTFWRFGNFQFGNAKFGIATLYRTTKVVWLDCCLVGWLLGWLACWLVGIQFDILACSASQHCTEPLRLVGWIVGLLIASLGS
jgi:hypothetical protein